MRYLALACDYDGTLAHNGKVDQATVAALQEVKTSGRKLLLVTGRELPELLTIFPELDIFDLVVAENGALLYQPQTKEERPLCDPPNESFVAALVARGVAPVSVGRTIVATWHPHEKTVLEVIRDLSLELQVIFNKGAVMVLPSGVNKAFGLKAALDELKLSAHSVVGVGDAENDHSFMDMCECAVAVSNALPMLKERADLVTTADHGAGVQELIAQLLDDDLRALEPQLTRHTLLLGTAADGTEVRVPPYGETVLIAGASGGGKSTFAASLLETLAAHEYQFCVIDPEGDYEQFPDAVCLGTGKRQPTIDELVQILDKPDDNAAINLVSVAFSERPQLFLTIMSRLQGMRAKYGRPHWILVDEAHHVLPEPSELTRLGLPRQLDRIAFVTVEPATLERSVLEAVTVIVGVGSEAPNVIYDYCRILGKEPPAQLPTPEPGMALVWSAASGIPPLLVKTTERKSEARRHLRKYTDGELPPERSFYFRGPREKMQLRAKNLISFLELSEGVDEETWMHHLKKGDYSGWFSEHIKDDDLASEARAIEQAAELTAAQSRQMIRELIETRYTLPASKAAEPTAPSATV